MLGLTPQKLVLYTVMGNQTALNVLYGQLQGYAGPEVADQAVVDALSLAVSPNMIGIISARATYWGATVQKLAPKPNPNPTYFSRMGSGVGTFDPDALPSQTCGIITKRTAFAGRAGRGRIYLPFPGVSASTADAIPLPTPGYLASVTALAPILTSTVSFTVGMTTYFWDWYINSTKVGFAKITSAVVRTKWATQRRRGSEGRPNPPPF